MSKAFVVMTFLVDVPADKDFADFCRTIEEWSKEDTSGFLLARPTVQERLAQNVIVHHVPVEGNI